MPRPPDGLFNQINYVIKFWADPCDAPWTIYVETALPAALEAFATYFAMDRLQMLEAQLRPSKAIAKQRAQKKGRRGSKAGRWGRLGRLASAAQFDPNESIGKKMQGGMHRLGPARFSTGYVHAWLLYGIAQRFFFWWMVADIILDFWLNWTSSLYETVYCQELERALLLATGPGQFISGIVDWNPLLTLDVEKQRGTISVLPGGATIGEGIYNVTFTATFSDTPGEYEVVLAIFDGEDYPEGSPVATVSGTTGPNRPVTLTIAATISGPGSVMIAASTGAGLQMAEDKHLLISGG